MVSYHQTVLAMDTITWLKNRYGKHGGGVMILTKKNLKVTEVGYGVGNVELITITVGGRGMDRREFVVCYVPPKTKS